MILLIVETTDGFAYLQSVEEGGVGPALRIRVVTAGNPRHLGVELGKTSANVEPKMRAVEDVIPPINEVAVGPGPKEKEMDRF